MAGLAERYSGPIEWGVSDCAPMACDTLLDATGDDLMAGYRTYATRDERDALLEREGGLARLTLRVMKDRAEWRLVAPDECEFPGLGLVKTETGHSLALSVGCGWFVTKVGDGVAFLNDAQRAWQWA